MKVLWLTVVLIIGISITHGEDKQGCTKQTSVPEAAESGQEPAKSKKPSGKQGCAKQTSVPEAAESGQQPVKSKKPSGKKNKNPQTYFPGARVFLGGQNNVDDILQQKLAQNQVKQKWRRHDHSDTIPLTSSISSDFAKTLLHRISGGHDMSHHASQMENDHSNRSWSCIDCHATHKDNSSEHHSEHSKAVPEAWMCRCFKAHIAGNESHEVPHKGNSSKADDTIKHEDKEEHKTVPMLCLQCSPHNESDHTVASCGKVHQRRKRTDFDYLITLSGTNHIKPAFIEQQERHGKKECKEHRKHGKHHSRNRRNVNANNPKKGKFCPGCFSVLGKNEPQKISLA
ncbi:uncharacterized protein LOC114653647 isoform X12 [Erpetoichthys calabaricus]|uniref:uncharacterized protein LOC114653647 isoform X12 n=1 Tax=Erpetoichthys calabaricus TaxID=27687 RepID=UPI002233FECD|nr:uncharacterized protein LOC114653647 isoform X12 [Erpetoichthys calabaricus]